jgi:hypothetical protein
MQVLGLKSHFEYIHLVWLEGDSTDNTLHRLRAAAKEIADRHLHITLAKYDFGGRLWPSLDHAARLRQVVHLWNKVMQYVPAYEWVCIVVSELIWSADVVPRLIDHVARGRADVVYPALYIKGSNLWYDTNTFRLDGERFLTQPPYLPRPLTDGEQQNWPLVKVDTGGGMIIATRDRVSMAHWQGNCILTFPEDTRCVVDMSVRIEHP